MAMKSVKRNNQPLYPIGIASKLVGVCPATLRIWERKGLLSPSRIGKNRYYTDAEVYQLKYIKFLLREKGANLAGVKEVLEKTSCWAIKHCKQNVRDHCPVYRKYVAERELTRHNGAAKSS
jgi:MerR family transcriptional regulator/heat shock protein HspR